MLIAGGLSHRVGMGQIFWAEVTKGRYARDDNQ